MGLSMISPGEGEYRERAVAPNPNPENFKIVEITEYSFATYAEIIYPDCTSFEGRKILIYMGRQAEYIRNAKSLDPHFAEDGIAPIARFVPNETGKLLASKLLYAMALDATRLKE